MRRNRVVLAAASVTVTLVVAAAWLRPTDVVVRPTPALPRPVPVAAARPPPPSEPFPLTDAPIPGFPDFRKPGATVVKLDELAPTALALPEVRLPTSVEGITDTFVVQHDELPNPQGKARKLTVLRAPLPFPVELDEQTFKPEGMVVSIDGLEVPFSRTPAPKATGSTWRINGKQLVLSHPTLPAPGGVVVRFGRVRTSLDDHDPAKAARSTGGSPADFLRWQTTIGGQTRHGLALVAPTRVEWALTVPEGAARFEGWLALEAAPLDKPRSDGAAVSLVVVDATGAETLVDRQELAAPQGDFQQWRADLSPWAGQPVRLRLETDPLREAVFDWVFVGSPVVWGKPAGEVRRVVVVALDTTRADRLSSYGFPLATTPEIDRWSRTGVQFDRTWSTAPRTRPSFRSSTTGNLPLEAVNATNIAEVFDRNHFATVGFVANVHLQPRFSFDEGFDWWWFDGKATAQDEVDRTLAWLHDNPDRDAYLFVHFMDPHMAYDAPGEWRNRFVTDPDPTLPAKVQRADVVRWMQQGTITDQRKRHLEQLHLGELAYTSSELGRLFDAVDALPGRTLVVLYSDHGEEFWEHGGFEHNHSLYDELTHVVFTMRPAKGLPQGRREATPTSLMDLAPTLYDLFGLRDAPPTDGRSLVPLLAGVEPVQDRPLPVGYLQYSHERWGVVWNGHKYILHTGSGQEELYDLVADGGEQADLAAGTNLAPYRDELGRAHRIPVGPGWRIRVSLDPKGPPLVLQLPAPARLAGVLDPEAVVEHRANIEWGETPQRWPGDIGTVDLSDDKRTLTYAPGPRPSGGVLYAIFDEALPCDGVSARLGTEDAPITPGTACRYAQGRYTFEIVPGTVVVPVATEASRMGITQATGSSSELEELCLLGYVTEGCAEILSVHRDGPG